MTFLTKRIIKLFGIFPRCALLDCLICICRYECTVIHDLQLDPACQHFKCFVSWTLKSLLLFGSLRRYFKSLKIQIKELIIVIIVIHMDGK